MMSLKKLTVAILCSLVMVLSGCALAAHEKPATTTAEKTTSAAENASKREIASDSSSAGTGASVGFPSAVSESAAESVAPSDGVELSEEWSEPYWPDYSFNTEEYDHITEQGFIPTSIRPLSSLSADVDTASYANLRRLLRARATAVGTYSMEMTSPDVMGWDTSSAKTIPAGAVRIEEMLNYFDYDYNFPAAGQDFSVTSTLAPCPWNPDTKLLVLGFATAHESEAQNKGRNLVFLIDVSGSMADDDKLGLLKDSFAYLVDDLTETDRISIVTYASGEQLICDGVLGSERRQILSAIRGLQANGATDGQRGLALAYELAEKNFIEGGVNRIIMASDGDLNVGMTSTSELHDYVDTKRQSGVYLSVLGFGAGNYKDNKMETLADHGNGSYHYIDCIEEAERVFSERLTKNLVPFADDVKVQLEFNPEEVKAYRLIGYENRSLEDTDFLDDKKDAADVGPDSQFTVAYEVVPVDSAMEIEIPELHYSGEANNTRKPATSQDTEKTSEYARCSLRWRAFADNEVKQLDYTVSALDEAAQPSDDWNIAAAIIELGMELRSSDYKGTTSYASAGRLLDACENDGRAQELREMLALVEGFATSEPSSDLK
ncbi:MAG: von Willebrand factor type A domain-containing protein [Atopobiaceae bacterium]|nr:von Willebrand factor type A domain-containing protein [Atopobiaceae bacterium]